MFPDALQYGHLIGTSIFRLGDIDPYLALVRADSSVRYKFKIPHFEIRATQSFGRDAASGFRIRNVRVKLQASF
jgi:hypothetical protein